MDSLAPAAPAVPAAEAELSSGQAGLRSAGLVLRRATPADAGALADFNARQLSDNGPEQPEEELRLWTCDLLTRPHPTFTPGDFTLVEEAATGRIVSSLCLISQTWAYAGLPFGVGRPELVSTLPEYRRRGLVRLQFGVIHRWSAERGHLVQGITGIPFYYRQFGYEMALAMTGRAGFDAQVPRLPAGAAEPFTVRPAAESDLPFIASLYARAAEREPVIALRDDALWRYELAGRSPGSAAEVALRVIAAEGGEPVGCLVHPADVWTFGSAGIRLVLTTYELEPGVSWLAVTPSVIRYLWQTGQDYAARRGKTLQRFVFGLGESHPVYDGFPSALPAARLPYAWYVRVPDLPAFLRHVAPALEQRLARSIAAGHSATLDLNFFRSGLRLVLERGRLAAIEPWQPPHPDNGSAGFPDLTFLQLLFGHRSLDDLRRAFPDCWVDGDLSRALLNALFPQASSNVWPIA
jgi:hypothetical protein